MLTTLTAERMLQRRTPPTRRQGRPIPAAPELEPLRASELERLACLTRGTMLIPAGSYLVQHGHPFYDLYAVRGGRIRAGVLNAAGYLRVFREYHAGEIIGLDALRCGNYLADFVALEASTVCPIPLYMLGDLTARQAAGRRARH